MCRRRDLSTRRLYRLTHTLGGLFYPVVDPSLRWVYATSYGARGYDVVRFRWEPERWTLVWEPPASESAEPPELADAAEVMPEEVPAEEVPATVEEAAHPPSQRLPSARSTRGGAAWRRSTSCLPSSCARARTSSA